MMSFRMKISPPVRLIWKSVVLRERLAQRVESQFLAPLSLDIQEVADVAELAVQIAPHRRLVDGSHRQPIGAAGLLVDEALDPPLVACGGDSAPRHGGPAAARARGSRSSARSLWVRAIELPDLQRWTGTLQGVGDPRIGVVQERFDPRPFSRRHFRPVRRECGNQPAVPRQLG